MSALTLSKKAAGKPSSGRRRVDRKIFRFSVLIGVAGIFLTAFAYIASTYPLVLEARDNNLHALSEIRCAGAACDTSAFSGGWQWTDPDYVVDTETGFIISVPDSSQRAGRFTHLDYSDATFLAKFHQPTSYTAPDGEVWRLYSRASVADSNRRLEIVVGYAVDTPWKAIVTPSSLMGEVDAALMREADKIASTLSMPKETARLFGKVFSADGFQVVDMNTSQIVEQGPYLPAFLPRGVPLPTPGLKVYIDDGKVYIARTDTSGRLMALSFTTIGGLWWIVCLCAIGFLCATAMARSLSRRFLRNYFALTGIRVPGLEEALRNGEGQNVEFKRGLSDDENRTGPVEEELLKSIAAFANTNDGVILVGIDDAGHLKGLGLNFRQRDRLEQKIYQLIRTRLRPIPPVRITFEHVRGLVIAKIEVGRGESPAYMMGGAIYMRNGSSDVQAQTEDVVRLVSQYAF